MNVYEEYVQNYLYFCSFLRPHSDTRINKAVADIDHKACNESDGGVEAGSKHKDRIVTTVNSIDGQTANAGNGEDLFNDQRTAQDADELAKDGGTNDHEAVTHSMTHGSLCLSQAHGAGPQHELTGQNFSQLRTGGTGKARNNAEGQGHDGRKHTDKHGPGEIIRAGFHQEGQPAKLIAEDILDQEGVNEAGHRNNHHGKGGDCVIDPGILLQRSKNTQANAKGNTEQNGIQVNDHGNGQLVGENLHNVLAKVQLITDTPVKLSENILKENAELNHIGFIVALGLTAGLNDSAVGISGGQLHGRQHPDKDEAHAGDDQQHQAHIQNSL